MSDLKQYWDEAHVTYSQQNWIDKPSIFAGEIIKNLPPKGKLLDLASGQGQDARYFAKHGYQVVATDLSQHALDLSNSKAEAEGLKIETIQADLMEPLPFGDDTFDIVYSHLGLHYFCKEDTKKILKEIKRVLKPDGVLAAMFNTVVDPELREYGYEEVEPHYFKHLETGVCKSYFSPEYLSEITADLFEPVLLDEKGKSYKDDHENLIRFVAKNK